MGTVTAFNQGQVADEEMETPGYTLINVAMGAHLHDIGLTLSANNLFDKKYLDHLSRFRAYDIPEPGLNVSLSVNIALDALL